MSNFRVVEHVARCQHTRERPAAAIPDKLNDLRLHVKQYIPKNASSSPSIGDVTLIGAHANAFPKELYEPLWDEIYEKLQATGRNIRGIWIADQVNQGQSGIINEAILGNDPSWWDHGRDLLLFINQNQDDIPHPIIGVGHSMGGMQLTHLSLIHPSLLDGLVLIDPVIQKHDPSMPYALASTYRRDVWPSRDEARRKFQSSKFYQAWDERVLDKWIQYGLRDLPTEQYPDPSKYSDQDSTDKPVTLATTKSQEVFNFLRPAYPEPRKLLDDPPGTSPVHRDMHPDDIDPSSAFYRPEPPVTFRHLPEVKPPVLYIFGDKSDLSPPEHRAAKMAATGTAHNGSGGAAQGRVHEKVLSCGHLVPMELPKECADAAAAFIVNEVERWSEREERRKKTWETLSRQEMVEVNDEWRARIGQLPGRGGGTTKRGNGGTNL